MLKKILSVLLACGVIGHSPAVPIIANQEFAAVAKKLKVKKDRERKISFVVGVGTGIALVLLSSGAVYLYAVHKEQEAEKKRAFDEQMKVLDEEAQREREEQEEKKRQDDRLNDEKIKEDHKQKEDEAKLDKEKEEALLRQQEEDKRKAAEENQKEQAKRKHENLARINNLQQEITVIEKSIKLYEQEISATCAKLKEIQAAQKEFMEKTDDDLENAYWKSMNAHGLNYSNYYLYENKFKYEQAKKIIEQQKALRSYRNLRKDEDLSILSFHDQQALRDFAKKEQELTIRRKLLYDKQNDLIRNQYKLEKEIEDLERI